VRPERPATPRERPLWEQYRAQIDALAELPLNFDLERSHEYTEANGWRIDDYLAELPPEPAGPPLEHGSWAITCQMLREYRFPDPSIVTGIYYPDQPLAERVILLRARAYWMTFYFGVRVGAVIDEVRDGPHGPEQVWGFNYRTLQGHYERGQMDFTAVKQLETGAVSFRIHAFSQPAEIANLIFRIGFHLLGRRVQRRFAKRALERMQRLVADELDSRETGRASPPEAPAVQPASADEKAAEKLEEVRQESE
jgi:hypothetical protein